LSLSVASKFYVPERPKMSKKLEINKVTV